MALAKDGDIDANILLQAAMMKAMGIYDFLASLPKDDKRRCLLRDADVLIQQVRTASLWDIELNRLMNPPEPDGGGLVVVKNLNGVDL